MIAQFPHCDQRILHAPGECNYRDGQPLWQELRRSWGIAFTGHKPLAGMIPCPPSRQPRRPPQVGRQQADHRHRRPGLARRNRRLSRLLRRQRRPAAVAALAAHPRRRPLPGREVTMPSPLDPHSPPGTVSRSPFAEVVIEDSLDTAALAATLRRIEQKEEQLMAVQDDINAAVTAINGVIGTVADAATALEASAAAISAQAAANGADTSALNTAVAGIPAVTQQLADAQAAVTALAPQIADTSTADAPT